MATALIGLRFVRQPEASQRHAGEPDAKLLQCRATRDRLGHTFGEFIELVVHNSSLVVLFLFVVGLEGFRE